jgi:hypothetical protein
MSKQFLKYGVPFIAIVLGGTLFMTQMSQAKYERHDRGIELAKVNRPVRPPPKFELEKELEVTGLVCNYF